MARVIQSPVEQLGDYWLRKLMEACLEGSCIALPLETFWIAIGAANSRQSLLNLRRCGTNPLVLLVRDLAHCSEYAWFDDAAFRVMREAKDSDTTFILKTRKVPSQIPEFKKFIRIRFAKHPVLKFFLQSQESIWVFRALPSAPEAEEATDDIEQRWGEALSYILDEGKSVARQEEKEMTL